MTLPSVANAELLSEPAYLWIPEGASFDTADEVLDLARALGQQVDQPEIDAIRTLMAEGPDGQFAGFGSAIICGRQNIKTWAIRMCVIYDAWVRGVPRVTFSAHLFKTTRDSFAKIDELVQSFDWMRQATKQVRYANGEEGFELANGGRIDFVARSLRGSRGLGGDTVVLDEWLFGRGDMLGALVPTMSTAVKPHILYGSSPGLRESESLREIRDRGRSGGDPTLTYIEWTTERNGCASPECTHRVGRVEGCELDDETKWPRSNPALGRRISVDYVRKERREIPPAEFMVERMGWWQDPPAITEDRLVPAEAWEERRHVDSTIDPESRVAVAIDTSWDRQATWVAVAGFRSDGAPHVEIAHVGFSTDWVPDFIVERASQRMPVAIGLQGSGAPVSSLLEQVRARLAGRDANGDTVPGLMTSTQAEKLVRGLGVQDLGRACGLFYDRVVNGPLAHIGQEQLDAMVDQAQARPIGESWVVDRKASAVDVAGLVAVIEALYLLLTTEPPKKRKSRVVGW